MALWSLTHKNEAWPALGKVKGRDGYFVGIELDEPMGKNDGRCADHVPCQPCSAGSLTRSRANALTTGALSGVCAPTAWTANATFKRQGPSAPCLRGPRWSRSATIPSWTLTNCKAL